VGCGDEKTKCGSVCYWEVPGPADECTGDDWDPNAPHASCYELEEIECCGGGFEQAYSAVTLVLPANGSTCPGGVVGQCSEDNCGWPSDPSGSDWPEYLPGHRKCDCHKLCTECGDDCSTTSLELVIVYECGCPELQETCPMCPIEIDYPVCGANCDGCTDADDNPLCTPPSNCEDGAPISYEFNYCNPHPGHHDEHGNPDCEQYEATLITKEMGDLCCSCPRCALTGHGDPSGCTDLCWHSGCPSGHG